MTIGPRTPFLGFALLTAAGLISLSGVSGDAQTPAAADVGPRIQASLREIPSPASPDSEQPHLVAMLTQDRRQGLDPQGRKGHYFDAAIVRAGSVQLLGE